MICTEKYKKNIEGLNEKLLQHINTAYPVGLFQGKMGISIYFYNLYRINKNSNNKVIAEQLLDNLLDGLSSDLSISVEKGLAGIALGVKFLIKSRFIEGDINELLKDIDNIIFKHLFFLQSNSLYTKEEKLHMLFFLYIRLIDQIDENSRYMYQEVIIKLLEIFVAELNNDFFNEPFSFSIYHYHLPLFLYICACLLKQNFYNNRICKILEIFEPQILSRFPILHVNRLYLLCGILSLIPYMRNRYWKDYANLLQKEINLQNILEKEMKNKRIFISNGLSMVYLLLHYLEKNHPRYKISYKPIDFYNRIIASEAWESLLNHDYFFNIHSGLLNGFPGVQLVLSHIQNKTNED